MQHRSRVVLLALLLLTPCVFAGDLHILCEPGLRISVDGELQGLSTARADGLSIMNLEPGSHEVCIEKDGFLSQKYQVEIGELPSELQVGPFITLPKLSSLPPPLPAGEQKQAPQEAGELTITSAPQVCTVEIDGKSEIKDKPILKIRGVSADSHVISFKKDGFETISKVIEIIPGDSVQIHGNLDGGRVEVVHEGEGSLRVVASPHNCTMLFRGKVHDNIGIALNRSKIPAGEYPARFLYRGRQLDTTILIKDGHRTLVRVSFMDSDIPFTFSYEKE